MAKGIKRKLLAAQRAVQKEIAANGASGNVYARGLAGEGRAGGYSDALADVLLLLNGCPPCRSPQYWFSDTDNKQDERI